MMHLQLPVVVRFPLWQSLHIAALMCGSDVSRIRTFFNHAPLLSGYSHTHHSCPINFQVEGCLSKASFICEEGGTIIAGIVDSRAGWGFKKCLQHSPLHWSQWPPQGLLGSGTGNGRYESGGPLGNHVVTMFCGWLQQNGWWHPCLKQHLR